MAPATKGSLGGASFRSAVSATSYRSCVSHASFRSCVSSVYHECGGSGPSGSSVYHECSGSPASGRHETFHSLHSDVGFHSLAGHSNDGGGFHSLAGHSNDGFQSSLDNVSYYSVTDSLAGDVPSLPAIAAAAPPSNPLSAADKEVEKEPGGAGCVYLGYAFAILAGVSFTASNAVLSHLPLVDPWLLLLLRSVLQLVVMSIFMACSRQNPLGPSKGRWKLPLQSIILGLLIVAIYLSVTRLPHGDVSCLFLLTPLVTVLLSTCLLRERCGLYRCVSSIVLVVGVLLLARPRGLFRATSPSTEISSSLVQLNIYGWPVHFSNGSSVTSSSASASMTNKSAGTTAEVVPGGGAGDLDVVGMLAAVAVPIMSAYLLVLIRSCRAVPSPVLLAWSSVGPLVVATVGLLTLGTVGTVGNVGMLEGPQQWLLMVATAVLGITGNLLMTKAASWVAPSRVAILLSSSVVLAYIVHIAMYRLVPVLWDLGGVALVLAALVATAVENLLLNRIDAKWL